MRRELYPNAFENDEVPVGLVLEGPAGTRMIEVADSFGPSIVVEQRILEPGPLESGTQRLLRY